MFTQADVTQRLRRQPFMPVRIVTSSGESYDVTHPELFMIGRRDLSIGIPAPDEPLTYEQVARIAILHITAMEDLPVNPPAAPSTGANGQTQ